MRLVCGYGTMAYSDGIICCPCRVQRELLDCQIIACEAWQHVVCMFEESPEWDSRPYLCQQCSPESYENGERELDPHQAVEDRTPDHVKIVSSRRTEILRDNEGVKLHLQQLTWTPSLLQSTYLAAGSALSSALSVSNSTLAPTSGKRLLKGRSTGLKGYIGALREQKALISIHQGNIAEGDITAQ